MGGITLAGTLFIVAAAAGAIYGAGALMEPGASWVGWLLWVLAVWALIGAFFSMPVASLRSGLHLRKEGKGDEARDEFKVAILFGVAILAGLGWLGYRLYAAMTP